MKSILCQFKCFRMTKCCKIIFISIIALRLTLPFYSADKHYTPCNSKESIETHFPDKQPLLLSLIHMTDKNNGTACSFSNTSKLLRHFLWLHLPVHISIPAKISLYRIKDAQTSHFLFL